MATDQELIIKLRAQTTQLQKDLNKAKAKMRGFQKNISVIGAGIRSTMLAAFGGAAVLQGVKSILTNLSQFELQLAKLKAISGATESEFKSLSENALELGKSTEFTAGEIANLQLELSKLGFDTSQILASTAAIRKLATVTGEDLGGAAKTLAGTINSFNLEAEESGRIANVMAESFSKSALTLEKFTVGTANSGAIANALGVTLEQNTARLGALVDANIDASKAGTDLRKIYIDLNAAGLEYETALLIIAQSSDKVATATKLVGIRAAGALVILSEQRDKVKELGHELSDTNMEMDGMADIIENTLSISFDKLLSAIDGTIKKGGVFNDWLKDATDLATEFVTRQSESLGQTKQRQAVEEGTKAFKEFGNGIANATRFIEFYQKSLDKAAAKVTKFELLSRINNKTVDKTGKAYTEVIVPFLKLNTSMEAAKKVVSDYNAQLKIQEALLVKEAAAAKLAAEQLKIFNAFQGRTSVLTTQEGREPGVSQPLLPQITDEDIEAATANNGEQMGKFQNEFMKQSEELGMMMEMGLKGIASGVIISGFQEIGKAIGGGGNSLKDGFAAIGQVLAEGMQSLGAAMVAWGIAKIGLDKALTSGSGPVALAAGAALIVAGAALGAAIQNSKASSPIGGGSGGSGGSGRFEFDRAGQNIELSGEFKVQGTDLVLALSNQARQDNRNVAG